MVAADQEDLSRIQDLQGEQEHHNIAGVRAPVHKVPQEDIGHAPDVSSSLVGPGERIEELQQVQELSMDVSIYSSWQWDLYKGVLSLQKLHDGGTEQQCLSRRGEVQILLPVEALLVGELHQASDEGQGYGLGFSWRCRWEVVLARQAVQALQGVHHGRCRSCWCRHSATSRDLWSRAWCRSDYRRASSLCGGCRCSSLHSEEVLLQTEQRSNACHKPPLGSIKEGCESERLWILGQEGLRASNCVGRCFSTKLLNVLEQLCDLLHF
mmetsp:Transcript_54363/g.118971  ORF Transcript_54363/g.118971 Transcript_54363/m.118971 type:complete len:267 (+) Transcript_54363:767-1567(+)